MFYLRTLGLHKMSLSLDFWTTGPVISNMSTVVDYFKKIVCHRASNAGRPFILARCGSDRTPSSGGLETQAKVSTTPHPSSCKPNTLNPEKQRRNYTRNAHSVIAASGIEASHDTGPISTSAPDVRLSVLKTSSKPIFDVFAQLLSFTSGTSFGSAKVISTHYRPPSISFCFPFPCFKEHR